MLFRSFLNLLPSLDLWERGIDGAIVNFSKIGGYVFLSMGKILVHFFRIRKFAGDLMGRIQIRYDLTVSFTSPLMEENDSENSLENGLKTDILHFRYMIAQVILKSLGQDFEQKLSVSFKISSRNYSTIIKISMCYNIVTPSASILAKD